MDPESKDSKELDPSDRLSDLEILLSSILAHSSPEELSRIVKLVYQEQLTKSTEYRVLIHNSYGSFSFSDLGDKIMEMFDLDDEDSIKTRTHPALILAFEKFGSKMLSRANKQIILDTITIPFDHFINIDDYDGLERLEYHYRPARSSPKIKDLTHKELEMLNKFFEIVPKLYNENGSLIGEKNGI